MARVKRRYQSDIRAAAALETRRAITAAARRLFAARGFAATPIEAIAREAGVAVQTVYAVFGTKRAVLESLLDALDEAAEVSAAHAAFAGPVDRQPRALARFISRLFAGGADVIGAVRAAGAADPALRDLRRKGMARHRRAMRTAVARWSEAGVLRPGLGPAEAVVILTGITGYGLYADLRAEGWSRARYEAWLAESIVRLIWRTN